MTHDYKRNGTTTLFAALNVLDGTVIGRNMARHRHQEFIRFLNAIETADPYFPDYGQYIAQRKANGLRYRQEGLFLRYTFEL